MTTLKQSLLELIKSTSAKLPKDVFDKLKKYAEKEEKGTPARYAMDIIIENIELAEKITQPLCQDTGSILFFVKSQKGFDLAAFEKAAREAVVLATEEGCLRQNSVDPITGKNSGNNLGPGFPTFHFEQWDKPDTDVRLILKGGGCENCGIQYSLPNSKLGAERDLDGVKKCILDAVLQAQGKGCAPGILGVAIGGDRATGYLHSKEQFLRKLDDKNPDQKLDELEREIVSESNGLGIGPMGFGGKTTLIGCKIGVLNRLPASYFVSVSYMCWACRRQGVLLDGKYGIKEWL